MDSRRRSCACSVRPAVAGPFDEPSVDSPVVTAHSIIDGGGARFLTQSLPNRFLFRMAGYKASPLGEPVFSIKIRSKTSEGYRKTLRSLAQDLIPQGVGRPAPAALIAASATGLCRAGLSPTVQGVAGESWSD